MFELGTGSELQRVEACPGSAVLPRAAEATAWASQGQVLHAFLHAASEVGVVAALENVPGEHRTACELMRVEKLPLDRARFRAEASFAYCLDTERARYLGQNLGRQYAAAGVQPNEVPFTIDLAGVVDGVAMAGDYKTGFGHVPPAPDNMQIGIATLAIADVEGLHEGRGAIIRAQPGFEPSYDETEFGPYELEGIRERLRNTRAQVREQRARSTAGKPVDVQMGDHCRYCPAKAHCPAFQQLLGRLGSHPDDVALEIRSAVTPELAARAYRNLRLAKQALATAEAAVRAWAEQHPIDLGDGTIYGLKRKVEKQIDGSAAFKVMAEILGPEAAQVGVDYEATQASIMRAAEHVRDTSAAAKKPSAAGLQRQVLDALKARGALKEVEKTPELREHRPKPAAAANAAPAGAPDSAALVP